eukprot:scaffold1256_cov47-Cyclotella_meneghiniana.AAC.2
MYPVPLGRLITKSSPRKQGGVLSRSMPPINLTQDEEIKAVRNHLKKKRSRKSLSSSMRSSGRSLQISDSGSEEDPLDKELEEMFHRKHSLSLDERIAHKQEKQSRNAALILPIDQDTDSRDFSSSIACLPDYEHADAAPLSYTVDEASTAAQLYEKRLSQRTESDEDSKEKQLGELRHRRQSLTLDGHDLTAQYDGEDLSSSIAHLPDFEPTDSAPLSYSLEEASTAVKLYQSRLEYEKKMSRKYSSQDNDNNVWTAAATYGDDVSDYLDRLMKQNQRRASTYDDRSQSKMAKETKEKQSRILHRRTICHSRPGITHVLLSPSERPTKEDKTDSDAQDMFERRLLLKLSQGSTKSLPIRRTLPARSQSDDTYDHLSVSSKSSRLETKNRRSAVETSDFSTQSESTSHHVASKSAKKERPKMSKSSKSERVLRRKASTLQRTRRKTHHVYPSSNVRETKQPALQWSDLKSAIDEAILRSKELGV